MSDGVSPPQPRPAWRDGGARRVTLASAAAGLMSVAYASARSFPPPLALRAGASAAVLAAPLFALREVVAASLHLRGPVASALVGGVAGYFGAVSFSVASVRSASHSALVVGVGAGLVDALAAGLDERRKRFLVRRADAAAAKAAAAGRSAEEGVDDGRAVTAKSGTASVNRRASNTSSSYSSSSSSSSTSSSSSSLARSTGVGVSAKRESANQTGSNANALMLPDAITSDPAALAMKAPHLPPKTLKEERRKAENLAQLQRERHHVHQSHTPLHQHPLQQQEHEDKLRKQQGRTLLERSLQTSVSGQVDEASRLLQHAQSLKQTEDESDSLSSVTPASSTVSSPTTRNAQDPGWSLWLPALATEDEEYEDLVRRREATVVALRLEQDRIKRLLEAIERLKSGRASSSSCGGSSVSGSSPTSGAVAPRTPPPVATRR